MIGARYGREAVAGRVNGRKPVECLRGAFGRRRSRPRLIEFCGYPTSLDIKRFADIYYRFTRHLYVCQTFRCLPKFPIDLQSTDRSGL